jgi:hypothetical protein
MPEDGGRYFFRNIGIHLQDYYVPQPKDHNLKAQQNNGHNIEAASCKH